MMNTVIDLIKTHEANSNFYSLKLNEEIDFLSEHFYELSESQEKEIQEMNPNIIERIIRNKKLSLCDEDQLLHFINHLFTMNNEFSPLYEEVIFTNISCECVEEFISVFDSSQMTIGTWNSISKRLVEEIQKKKEDKNERYCKNYKKIPFLNESLNGIFSYLRSNSNIKEEVEVTYSSKSGGDNEQLLDISNQKNYFYTSDSQDSWICFEFKKRQVVLSNYSIRSNNNSSNNLHMKNWVIEGSDDGKDWIKIDEQNNSNFLNGPFYVHTFTIKRENENKKVKNQEFKYLRIRQTAPNWSGNYFLELCSVEFYGKIL